MLIYLNSSLFESSAQVLVNTVNTEGVMGKGIALQFKKLFPKMFTQYQRFCEQHLLEIGKLWIYRDSTPWVLNFPTKTTWRRPSKASYVEDGLKKFVATYEAQGIQSIAFPQLGTGNGGLDWNSVVKPLMERYLRPLPIRVYIHLYTGWQQAPEHQKIHEMREWLERTPQGISVDEFVHELIAQQHNISQANRHTVSFQQLESFREPSQPLIRIEVQGSGSYQLSFGEVADIWTRLRKNGVLLDFELPQAVLEFHDEAFIHQLFSSLPYIYTIKATMSNSESGMSALAIKQSGLPKSDPIASEQQLMEG